MVTGLPASVFGAMRKNLMPSTGVAHTRFRIARDFGPCSESAAICSVSSEIATSMPTAFMCSQRSEGSAEVSRKLCSPRRVIVPSSSSLPSSSHQPV
jgi:hypothetical protein